MMLWILLAPAGCLGVQDTDSAWQEWSEPQEPLVIRQVAERGYESLRIEGERVLRTREGAEDALGSAYPEGTGEVFALCPDPAGLTWIAAEGGLFLTSPQVEVVDRVDLLDGAPPGTPNSLHVDDQRRVWYATDEAFGCIDPSFYFGRTVPVPAAPPYRILAHREEGIVLSTGEGMRLYRPGRGELPTVTEVSLEGEALEREQLLELSFGEEIPLEAEGSGVGGPRYRYRVDQHHVWLWMENGVDIEIEPGSHLLEIVAVDRDLRYSEPFPLRLTVAYPFYYQKEFVLGCAVLAVLLVFALFHLLSRNVQPAKKRFHRSFVSTVVTLVLALQILAGAVPHGRGWPFIGYSMYTTSLDVGHVAYNGQLVGITEDGRPRHIPIGALGVAADNRWQVLGPLIRGGAEVNRNAIEKYNGDRPTWPPIVRLQVWAERTLLTEDKEVPISQMVLSDYVMPEKAE